MTQGEGKMILTDHDEMGHFDRLTEVLPFHLADAVATWSRKRITDADHDMTVLNRQRGYPVRVVMKRLAAHRVGRSLGTIAAVANMIDTMRTMLPTERQLLETLQ